MYVRRESKHSARNYSEDAKLFHELLTRGSVLHANNESKRNKKNNSKQDLILDYTQLCINSKHIIARATETHVDKR